MVLYFSLCSINSDLVALNSIKINFDKNKPFSSFEQLLSVLPPYSTNALLIPFRKLMTNTNSPIYDFYPSNFKLDTNNQPYTWMRVNLLPFIDAERIKKIVKFILDK